MKMRRRLSQTGHRVYRFLTGTFPGLGKYTDRLLWNWKSRGDRAATSETFLDVEEEALRSGPVDSDSESSLPRVLICGHAMQIGGGEIFPIHLANALREMGVPVIYADCRMEPTDEGVRQMLHSSVPLVELRNPLDLEKVIDAYGIEVVHSHHGAVDKLLSQILFKRKGVKQVVTLHGMYESIDEMDLRDILHTVVRTVDTFAYIADKNLEPFRRYGYLEKCRFVKIGNGLESGRPAPVPRTELGIPENAFVLCLVSRARFDKGWLEACEAVLRANEQSEREIHLILVGDGEAYESVSLYDSPYIHAVGAQGNPRAYFMAADMGFLPTYFAGESFPLVVIESLMCGKPVLATRIGEIPSQITLPDGRMAGVLFELKDGKVPVAEVAGIIARLARAPEEVARMQACTDEAAERFDIRRVAEEYLGIYRS